MIIHSAVVYTLVLYLTLIVLYSGVRGLNYPLYLYLYKYPQRRSSSIQQGQVVELHLYFYRYLYLKYSNYSWGRHIPFHNSLPIPAYTLLENGRELLISVSGLY